MKYMVFTDSDLDGVVSFLVFKWFHSDITVDYVNTTITKFREDYVKWLSKTNTNEYDKIFILDLDVHEHLDLLDTKKHFIIDHHKTHCSVEYKNATAVVKIYTSCAKLSYKVFNTLYSKDLTDNQKTLVLLADDYDSYTHALPQSKLLNILYWNTQNRFTSFLKTFYNGFSGFNFHQSNTIKIFQQELNTVLDELKMFHTEFLFNGSKYKVMSSFATKFINDVADFMLFKHNADVAVVVNMNTKHISLRKNKDVDINLIEFTEKICNSGGGHEYATGADLTTEFLEFTKTLQPYE